MTIDEAEKAFIEALDKSMGNLNRGDWYKRKTVRMAFRKGWEQAIEEMKVNNCYTPVVVKSVCFVCNKKQPTVCQDCFAKEVFRVDE